MKKEETRRRIGQELAEIRKSQHLTQQDVADMAGLQRSNVARVEQGRYNVGLDILQAIADALNADVIIKPRQEKAYEN